jgi:DCN1-like protein 1/2
MSSASEKKALKEFKAVVPGVQDKVALELLKAHKFNAERAIDAFYQGGGKGESKKAATGKASETQKTNLNKIFDKYAGEQKQKDKMSDDKLGQFFKDSNVDPERDAVTTLGAAWKLKCKTLGEIQRSEFVDGFANLGADSMTEIKNQLSSIKSQLSTSGNAATFKEFYLWVFSFIKDDEERKVVDAAPAMEMMSIVLADRWSSLNKWVEFVTSTGVKVISLDVWSQVLEFAKEVKDLSQYNPDESAWPGIFDDFVEFVKNPPKKKVEEKKV